MKPVVLYAEDDSNDVLLCRRAFEASGLSIDLRVVHDGSCIIKWLLGQGEYSDRDTHPMPSLIITDSKMPVKNGLDVLRWVRGHSDFQHIPVVLHYGSIFAQDLGAFVELGVTACVEKKSAAKKLVKAVGDILKVDAHRPQNFSAFSKAEIAPTRRAA